MRPARPRILAAYDFSEASGAALAEAIRMSRATRAELVILHVFSERPGPGEYAWKGGETQRERERCRLLDLLEREAADARSVQALARVRTVAGDPAERILEAITVEGASAVFLGADAHDGFVGALLGRVALRVVREAKAPVFVVRRRASSSPTDSLRHRRVVVGFDFTSASRAAVDAAVALAKSTGGEVRIVHALPTARSVDSEELAWLRARLEAMAAEARASGVPCTGTLVFGDPATVLVAETESDPASVIVLGAEPRSRISRLLLGDVTESVLRVTDGTVLVARAGPASAPLVAMPLIGVPNHAT